jgi:hypothetical protein
VACDASLGRPTLRHIVLRPSVDQSSSPQIGRSSERAGVSKSVYVYVPAGFNPDDVLPIRLHKDADFARYFLHKIICGFISLRHVDNIDDLYILINAENMRNFARNKRAYKDIKDSLISADVIECNNSYVVGEKSMGYRLAPKYSEMKHARVQVGCRSLTKKILRGRDDMPPDCCNGGVHAHLYRCLREIEIDHRAALSTLPSGEHEPSDETSIRLIQDRQFFFSVCEFGRVHTNLTNLRSGLRQYLKHRGRPLVNLDIRNSQPLVFALLLREAYQGQPIPDDVRLYIELVQAGRFYEHLMEASSIKPERRARFKAEFFGSTFFCRNDPVKPEARTFGQVFPNVYATIRAAKAQEHADLAHRLQRVESGLMIGGVATRLMRELPDTWIGTVHDSILMTEDRAESVKAIMLAEFARVGLCPSINIKAA